MEKLVISSSPHVKSSLTTRRVMLDVLISLLPAAIAGCVIFGWRALLILAVCVVSSVLSEAAFNFLTKKKQTVGDFSAAVTGLLLGMNLPTTVTVFQCIVGSVFAIVVVKCLFGGLGCNFANPAITARVFMLIAFAETASVAFPKIVEVTASATPLEAISREFDLPSLSDMFLGVRGGAIGETCILALLVGGIYLIVRGIIKPYIPVVFIGTVFIFSWLYLGSAELALYEILAGGLILGAFFMATDYVTVPITPWGKVVFAFGCGLVTCLIRFFGNYPEGVSFAILLMNIVSPYIEKWTKVRALGGEGK